MYYETINQNEELMRPMNYAFKNIDFYDYQNVILTRNRVHSPLPFLLFVLLWILLEDLTQNININMPNIKLYLFEYAYLQ